MSNNYFKASLDKVFTELFKQAGGPPLLPEGATAVSPWDEVEGEEKPIGKMTKDEVADFIRNLDDKTFNELKHILDNVEMPAADDMKQYAMEVSSPSGSLEDELDQMNLERHQDKKDKEDVEQYETFKQNVEKHKRTEIDVDKLEYLVDELGGSAVLWFDGNHPGSIYLSYGKDDMERNGDDGGSPHQISVDRAKDMVLNDLDFGGWRIMDRTGGADKKNRMEKAEKEKEDFLAGRTASVVSLSKRAKLSNRK